MSGLQSLIELEEIELNHYRTSHPNEGWENVFGGQVLAQATWAASRTINDNRICHSLHGYFLRPGKKDAPILYKVDRIRDGKSFTTRRVVAIQKGQAIFNMSISFQVDEEGLEHQFTAPKSPNPAALVEEKSSTITQGSLDQMEAIDNPNLPTSIDVLNIEERKKMFRKGCLARKVGCDAAIPSLMKPFIISAPWLIFQIGLCSTPHLYIEI